MVSRVIALIKEIAIAAWFGADRGADAFYLGYAVPAAVAGVVGSAVEMVLIGYWVRRESHPPNLPALASRRANHDPLRGLLGVVGVATVMVSMMLAAAAQTIMTTLGGPDVDPQAVTCLRVTAVLYLPAHMAIYVLGARLAAQRQFGWSASWLLVSSAVTLTALAALSPAQTDSPAATRPADQLAWATGVGYITAAVIMGAVMFAGRDRVRLVSAIPVATVPVEPGTEALSPNPPPSSVEALPLPGASSLAALLGQTIPLMVAAGIHAGLWLVDLALAGRLGEGAVSALQRAMLLSGTLVMLVVRAVAKPSLVWLTAPDGTSGQGSPALGQPSVLPQAQAGRLAPPLNQRLSVLLCAMSYGTVAVAAVTIALAEPIVSVLLERGRFDPTATAATAEALAAMVAALPFAAAAALATQALTAAGRTGRLVTAHGAAAILHLPVAIGLVAVWPDPAHRHVGIAAAAAPTALVVAVVGLSSVPPSLGGIAWALWATVMARGLVAGLAAGWLAQTTEGLCRPIAGGAVALAVAAIVGFFGYCVITVALGGREVPLAWQWLRGRLGADYFLKY